MGGGALWVCGSVCDPAPFSQMSQSDSGVVLSRAGEGSHWWRHPMRGAGHYGGGEGLCGGVGLCVTPPLFVRWANQRAAWC